MNHLETFVDFIFKNYKDIVNKGLKGWACYHNYIYICDGYAYFTEGHCLYKLKLDVPKEDCIYEFYRNDMTNVVIEKTNEGIIKNKQYVVFMDNCKSLDYKPVETKELYTTPSHGRNDKGSYYIEEGVIVRGNIDYFKFNNQDGAYKVDWINKAEKLFKLLNIEKEFLIFDGVNPVYIKGEVLEFLCMPLLTTGLIKITDPSLKPKKVNLDVSKMLS